MFDIQPNREPEPRREPVEPGPSRMPFAQPPRAPRTWWGTIPGQAAILAIIGGVIVILLGFAGVIGPESLR